MKSTIALHLQQIACSHFTAALTILSHLKNVNKYCLL